MPARSVAQEKLFRWCNESCLEVSFHQTRGYDMIKSRVLLEGPMGRPKMDQWLLDEDFVLEQSEEQRGLISFR